MTALMALALIGLVLTMTVLIGYGEVVMRRRVALNDQIRKTARLVAGLPKYAAFGAEQELVLDFEGTSIPGVCWCCGETVMSMIGPPRAWHCTDCEVTWMNLPEGFYTREFGALGADSNYRPHP